MRSQKEQAEFERLMKEGYKFFAEDDKEFAEWSIQFAQDWVPPFEVEPVKISKRSRPHRGQQVPTNRVSEGD